MSGEKILLIEDDREIASTLKSVLDAAEYMVQWASNGKDGKRVIDEYQPDLVITDMMMPQLGGFPVLDHLQTIPAETRPRVIMITANEGGRHKAYAEMLGVDNYLRKPFAMDILLEAVEKALEKRREQLAAAATTTEDAPKTKRAKKKPAE